MNISHHWVFYFPSLFILVSYWRQTNVASSDCTACALRNLLCLNLTSLFFPPSSSLSSFFLFFLYSSHSFWCRGKYPNQLHEAHGLTWPLSHAAAQVVVGVLSRPRGRCFQSLLHFLILFRRFTRRGQPKLRKAIYCNDEAIAMTQWGQRGRRSGQSRQSGPRLPACPPTANGAPSSPPNRAFSQNSSWRE